MPPTLEGLPTEVLEAISAILDTDHPTSLLSFACASKRCYAVASTALFRTVKVAIAGGDNQAPFQFVHALQTRLARDDAFEHVRRLILCPPEDSEDPVDWPYSSLIPCERGLDDDTGLFSCWDNSVAEAGIRKATIVEHEWEPVIRLVERLPGLADLYWVCFEQLPMRLLKVLHSQTSLCRLHHYTFKLGSPTEKSLTSYEHALLTSPCLYSIGRLDDYDFDDNDLGDDDVDLVSVRSILSPNLRRVYLCFDSDEIQQEDTGGDHRRPTPREVIHMEGRGRSPIPFSMVQAEAFGNFSALRVLALHHPVTCQGLKLPSPSDFPSLKTLGYRCHVDEDVTTEDWDGLAAFLRNLPYLTTLEIRGWDRSISFTPALKPRLRSLDLGTSSGSSSAALRDDHVHNLADLCPNLEDLHIEIRRSRGDAAEVARYRSLGRLARLRVLHIELDASPPSCIQIDADGCHEATYDTAIEPVFDEQDAEYLLRGLAPYRQGHLRDSLINVAIDEGLTRAIFQVINAAKPTSLVQPSRLSLERLELCVTGEDLFVTGDSSDLIFLPWQMSAILRILHQRCTVERDIRDDARQVLHAHHMNWYVNGDSIHRELNSVKNDKYWFGIWRRVWPAEKEGMNWWEGWKSFPLALDDGGSSDQLVLVEKGIEGL